MVMRDKRWKKLLGIDAILLGISLLALIVSISLLLKDGGLTNEQHALAKREPVGRFTSSLNDVRRRLDSGFAWTSIKANDHIYEGDNIFTGDDSEAEVQLFRGGSLMVDAKSLVVIRTHESSLHLDLQYGSLLGRVSTEAPLVLSQHGETRILKAPEQGQDAEVRIVSASGRKETKVQVLKGEVQLKNLPRQNPSAPTEQPASTDAGVLIRQNEFVELQPMSKPIVKTIDIELLAPTNGQSIWLEPTHSVQFEWKKKNATTADRIEFSRTASFETVFYSAESTSGTFSLPATQRLEGIFYWRIISSTASLFGASSEPQSSGVNRVALYPDVSPNLLSPDDKQVLTLTQNQSDLLLNLNWDDSSGSTEYGVQLTNEENPNPPLLNTRTADMKISTPQLKPGRYFWRVTGVHPQRKNSKWSEPRSFVIEAHGQRLNTPQIERAEINFKLTSDLLNRAPASAGEEGLTLENPESIEPVRWTETPGATSQTVSFEVEVSRDEKFEASTKFSLPQDKREFRPDRLFPGAMYVRVRALGTGGIMSDYTPSVRYKISLPAPALERIPKKTLRASKKSELKELKHTFELRWAPMPYVDHYEVDWGADLEFEVSKRFKVKFAQKKINVTQDREYFARVRAMDKDGQPISEFSETATASLKKSLAPAPLAVKPSAEKRMPSAQPEPRVDSVGPSIVIPQLMQPAPGTNLVTMENGRTEIRFRWQLVPSASGYEIQVAEDADFVKIIGQSETKGNSVVLRKPLPEGRIYWRVRAIPAAKAKGPPAWSDPFDINVLYQ